MIYGDLGVTLDLTMIYIIMRGDNRFGDQGGSTDAPEDPWYVLSAARGLECPDRPSSSLDLIKSSVQNFKLGLRSEPE